MKNVVYSIFSLLLALRAESAALAPAPVEKRVTCPTGDFLINGEFYGFVRPLARFYASSRVIIRRLFFVLVIEED